MSGQIDPWPEYCRRLNKHYRQGNLRILAGAGLSADSGFPSWGDLNRGLLRKYIAEDLGRDTKTQPIVREHLDELVRELYLAIGREAAAEFVWNSSTRENFFEDLRQILYGSRQLRDLPLTQVHWQVAGFENTAVFTTNFDPLLELARYRAGGGTAAEPDVSRFRTANPPRTGTEPDRSKIYHVHGWIDPDGICGGSFVLTESQYFELFSRQGQRPNQMLDYALTAGGAVLVLGMSLADVNLRRHLYLRSNNRISDSTEIYAVVKGQGNKLLDMYQTLHWANRGVRLIYVDDYDQIPRLLREVKYGLPAETNGMLPWMETTFRAIRELLPAKLVFSDPWQTSTRKLLDELVLQFRESFAIPPNEVVYLTLMGQVTQQYLGTYCDTRHILTGREAEEYSQQFRLRVSREKPQGVAGAAFSEGEPSEVLDNPEMADTNLSPGMREFYAQKGLRNWRSLLAIPVLWGTDHLPLLTMAISSNFADPFWTRFGEKQRDYQLELSKAVDLVVRDLLGETRAKYKKKKQVSLTMGAET